MTPEQVEQRLREIEERANRATPGPWYVHNPDDDMSMNVFLVSATPEEPDPWWDGESEAQKVVTITLLQSPPVACVADHRVIPRVCGACKWARDLGEGKMVFTHAQDRRFTVATTKCKQPRRWWAPKEEGTDETPTVRGNGRSKRAQNEGN